MNLDQRRPAPHQMSQTIGTILEGTSLLRLGTLHLDTISAIKPMSPVLLTTLEITSILDSVPPLLLPPNRPIQMSPRALRTLKSPPEDVRSSVIPDTCATTEEPPRGVMSSGPRNLTTVTMRIELVESHSLAAMSIAANNSSSFNFRSHENSVVPQRKASEPPVT